MMQHKMCKRLVLSALVSTAAVCAPLVVAAQGMTWDMVTTTKMEPAMMPGLTDRDVTMHGIANSKGMYRMDVVTSPDTLGPLKTGDYMIVSEGRMIVVHPSTKTYFDFMDYINDAMKSVNESMSKLSTQSSAVPAPTITVKGDTVSTSETLDGRPALHVRITMTQTMNMAGHSIPVTSKTDYWLVKLPVTIAGPGTNGSLLPSMGATIAAVNAVTKDLIKKEDGTAMKMVITTSVDMSEMGAMAAAMQSPVTTITTEMKNVKIGPVDESMLLIPTGYTKTVK